MSREGRPLGLLLLSLLAALVALGPRCSLVAPMGPDSPSRNAATIAVSHQPLLASPAPSTSSLGPSVAETAQIKGASVVAPSAPVATDGFAALPPLTFVNRNSRQSLTVRLYQKDGGIDEANARMLDQLLADRRRPGQVRSIALERRLLQLVFRAAYHFGATTVHVISAYRAEGRKHEGHHATGRAIDFFLGDTKSATLAAYLRKLPRVGVGVYTHSRTQYVHLDVRDVSYHWLDASPPGRHWRGMRLTDAAAPARDAAYRPSDDWPEPLLTR